jgi:hypothetical protein
VQNIKLYRIQDLKSLRMENHLFIMTLRITSTFAKYFHLFQSETMFETLCLRSWQPATPAIRLYPFFKRKSSFRKAEIIKRLISMSIEIT